MPRARVGSKAGLAENPRLGGGGGPSSTRQESRLVEDDSQGQEQPMDVDRAVVLQKRKRELEHVMDEHDSLVREVFHLHHFKSLLLYDPKDAKEDKSAVYQEFASSYDLLSGSSNTGPSRRTRRAQNERLEALTKGVTHAASVATNSKAPTRDKSKSISAVESPIAILNVGERSSISSASAVPPRAKLRDTPTVPNTISRTRLRLTTKSSGPPPEGSISVPCTRKRRSEAEKERESISTVPFTPTTQIPPVRRRSQRTRDDPDKETVVPGLGQVAGKTTPGRTRKASASPEKLKLEDWVKKVKRVKLTVRRPPPTVSHPLQIPRPRKFGGSLSALLHSYPNFEGDEAELEKMAQERAVLEERIAAMRKEGRLLLDAQAALDMLEADRSGPGQKTQSSVDKVPKPTDTWSTIVKLIITRPKPNKTSTGPYIASQIASKIKMYWEGVSVKEDKARANEGKRLRALAKSTIRLVIGEWKKAVFHIREQERLAAEAEEQRIGRQHLDAILNQSGQILEAQHLDLVRPFSRSRSRSGSLAADFQPDDEDSDASQPSDTDLDEHEHERGDVSGDEERSEAIDGDDDEQEHGISALLADNASVRSSGGDVVLEVQSGDASDEEDAEMVAVQEREDDEFPAMIGDKSDEEDVERSLHEVHSDDELFMGVGMGDDLYSDVHSLASGGMESIFEEPTVRFADHLSISNDTSDADEILLWSKPGSILGEDHRLDSSTLLSASPGSLPSTSHPTVTTPLNYPPNTSDPEPPPTPPLFPDSKLYISSGDDPDDDPIQRTGEPDMLAKDIVMETASQGQVELSATSTPAPPTDEVEEAFPTEVEPEAAELDGLPFAEASVVDDTERPEDAEDAEQIDEPLKSPQAPWKPPQHLEPYAVAEVDWVSESKVTPPLLLRGTLRPYQQSGLEWLASLHTNHLNGILADEMGLGKTIQTIALLAHLACDQGIWGPHLIIVPTSVLLNWIMEFKKFLPGFKVLSYHGTTKRRKELRQGWNDKFGFNVCVTSYSLASRDAHIFKRKAWYYMILDEAHMIKNFRSQRWNILLMFRSFRRLLLTGTPLQNNLTELWALLQFLMSGTNFANLKEFGEWFSNPLEKAIEEGTVMDPETQHRVVKLHTVLRPYLLRRLKCDVEKELPSKYEHLVLCRLSKRQRFLYDDFMSRAQTRSDLQSGVYQKIANILMQLRKVCNHPDLFEVRPIVTSFAMDRSAVADFEIKELLVRRMLLSSSQESVNMDLLGLNFAKTCGTSFLTALSTRYLQNNSFVGVGPGEAPVADTRTIDGYLTWRKYQKELHTYERNRHYAYLNRLRCNNLPVISLEMLSVVNQIQEKHLVPLPDGISKPILDGSQIMSPLVKSYSQRSVQMADIVDHFAFATPAVVASDLSRLALSSVPEHVLAQYKCDVAFDAVVHRSSVKLQIAFPDSSLLQFDCGKLQELAQLLRERKSGGHRVLIFTQMTRILDILEIFLNYHGYLYLRLDGATKIEDRQYITERFNVDQRVFAFIASSRSGGVGINLTGADTVIFYDSDFNPQMDRQCEDRAHRIGQIRDVHIYRFVSRYTVEEAMLRKANQKRSLDDWVIQKGEFDWGTFLSDADGGAGGWKLSALEKALGEAEDVEDAHAARVAANEEAALVGEDNADFAADDVPPTVVPPTATTETVEEAPAPVVEEQAAEEEEAEQEGGTTVDYMLSVVRADPDFFREWKL